MAAPCLIDIAYAEINALGGYVDRSDPIAVARDDLLGEVLEILDRLGARDARDLCAFSDFAAARRAALGAELEVAA